MNQYVINIQYELVVAIKSGNTVKSYRLQEKLLFSFEARALAVRHVTANKGGKTPGVDNIV